LVGVDGVSSDKPDQSANQEEAPAEPTSAVTQQETLNKVKLESNTEEVLVKEEPGTRSQVITADFYRKFIEARSQHWVWKTSSESKRRKRLYQDFKARLRQSLEAFQDLSQHLPV
jgi:hypothetical protein